MKLCPLTTLADDGLQLHSVDDSVVSHLAVRRDNESTCENNTGALSDTTPLSL